MHRIRIKRDILVERSHGDPVRFTADQEITAELHRELMGDLICFYVRGAVNDFVYFPTDAIEYELLKEGDK